MGRTPQEDVRIEHRRTQVTELYLKGWTQAAIAKKLGVSQATISSDLKAMRKVWRDSGIRNFDEAIGEQLEKLQLLRREMWAEWERSKKSVETARITQKNGEKRAEKTIRERSGDPRFLRIVLDIDKEISNLLGLDEVARAAGERLDEQVIEEKAMASPHVSPVQRCGQFCA